MTKKYMIMLVGIAAAIFVILGTVQYLMARYGAEKELLIKAQSCCQSRSGERHP